MNRTLLFSRTVLVCLALVGCCALLALAPHTLRVTQAQGGFYVSTFAGIPQAGFADGQGPTARFNAPLGICFDKDDNLIVADFRNARIRRIAPDGTVTTIAGGAQGFSNGRDSLARFNGPAGVATDAQGNILVADYGNHRVRRIDPEGNVTTVAGNGTYGSANGSGLSARFAFPTGIAVTNDGVIYVLDSGTNLVRKISPSGYVSTLAGSYNGYADGTGNAAQFSFSGAAPQLCLDAEGNLIIADFFNSRIRKVTPEGVVTTIAGGGDGDGPALQAGFFFATGIARDRAGNYVIADWHNAKVRRFDVATNLVSTIAGTGDEGHADGPASQALFTRPGAAAVNSRGEIFVSDYFTHTIRRIGAFAPGTPRPTATPTPAVTPTPNPTATPTPSVTPTPTVTPTPATTPTPTPVVTPTPTPTPIVTPTPPVTGANLLVNPSFETGDMSGWKIYTYYVEAGGAFIVWDRALVSEGEYALQFRAFGRRLADACAQDVKLAPGNYTVSCDVIPSYGTIATLGVQYNTGEPSSRVATPPSTAKRLTLDFTVTDGNIPVTIFAVGNQNRYIRSNFVVDNFVLVRR